MRLTYFSKTAKLTGFILTLNAFILPLNYNDTAFAQNESSVPTPEFDYQSTSNTIDEEGNVVTNSGQIELVWKVPGNNTNLDSLEFELQEGETPNFEETLVRYKGPDRASYISGLENGTFFFRVRAINTETNQVSNWSEPAVAIVEHHSLSFALFLFCIGAIVFLLTVSVIIHGTMTVTKEDTPV